MCPKIVGGGKIGVGQSKGDEQLEARGGWSDALVELALWVAQAASSYREAEELMEWAEPLSILHNVKSR